MNVVARNRNGILYFRPCFSFCSLTNEGCGRERVERGGNRATDKMYPFKLQPRRYSVRASCGCAVCLSVWATIIVQETDRRYR